MKTAIDQEDVESVRSHAHSLKGSAANVNADILKEIALCMEQSVKSGDLASLPRMLSDVEKAFAAFSREAVL